MDLIVRDNPEATRFEAIVGGVMVGLADYRLTGSEIAFTHTEVTAAAAGQGIGTELVRGALEAVRARGLAVLPFCPFVRRFIMDHPEFLDLVPASRQAGFELDQPAEPTG